MGRIVGLGPVDEHGAGDVFQYPEAVFISLGSLQEQAYTFSVGLLHFLIPGSPVVIRQLQQQKQVPGIHHARILPGSAAAAGRERTFLHHGVIRREKIRKHTAFQGRIGKQHGCRPARPVAVTGPASPLPLRGIQEKRQGIRQQSPSCPFINAVHFFVGTDKTGCR